ncbi:hypothetical protein DINM_002497 [Dirofilaria immitis]|nr:hypothetical protein [Dirofilaria immitis]
MLLLAKNPATKKTQHRLFQIPSPYVALKIIDISAEKFNRKTETLAAEKVVGKQIHITKMYEKKRHIDTRCFVFTKESLLMFTGEKEALGNEKVIGHRDCRGI